MRYLTTTKTAVMERANTLVEVLRSIDGESIGLDRPFYIKSYGTIVAFYNADDAHFYMRKGWWDYSPTTQRHVARFIKHLVHEGYAHIIEYSAAIVRHDFKVPFAISDFVEFSGFKFH